MKPTDVTTYVIACKPLDSENVYYWTGLRDEPWNETFSKKTKTFNYDEAFKWMNEHPNYPEPKHHTRWMQIVQDLDKVKPDDKEEERCYVIKTINKNNRDVFYWSCSKGGSWTESVNDMVWRFSKRQAKEWFVDNPNMLADIDYSTKIVKLASKKKKLTPEPTKKTIELYMTERDARGLWSLTKNISGESFGAMFCNIKDRCYDTKVTVAIELKKQP